MRVTAGGPYLWERDEWPDGLRWSEAAVAQALVGVAREEGRLVGLTSTLGLAERAGIVASAVEDETLMTSRIEGEILDRDSVRSSVRRRLGLDHAGLPRTRRDVDGLVSVLVDATHDAGAPLTAERLFGWHHALFPTGRSGLNRIAVGAWRVGEAPMQVVSGGLDAVTVHYEAPPSSRVPAEMSAFLHDLERSVLPGPVRAAIAHIRFVTIHPFEDGNGRIGRAVGDLALARASGASARLWSLSAQIEQERAEYYAQLKQAQRGTGEVTPWLVWMLGCMQRAIVLAQVRVQGVVDRVRFWDSHHHLEINARQRKLVSRMLLAGADGFEGGMTNRKAVSLTRASRATAQRDLAGLVELGVLVPLPARGRSAAYALRWWRERG